MSKYYSGGIYQKISILVSRIHPAPFMWSGIVKYSHTLRDSTGLHRRIIPHYRNAGEIEMKKKNNYNCYNFQRCAHSIGNHSHFTCLFFL